MISPAVRRRLLWLEIFLLGFALLLYYLITDRKDISYATGTLSGIGIMALAFFQPVWGLVCVLAIQFTESTINLLNALADVAKENFLSGVPHLPQTQWFAWGVFIIFLVLLLRYFCTLYLKGEKAKPLCGLEWALLMPFIIALVYLPISLLNEYSLMDYSMDIIPMCIYAGIVILARCYSGECQKGDIKYFYLDWFIIMNTLILLPLWAYNVIYQPWRMGYVGIAAIRYGTGPYDFNFFLVPLLGMLLTYDDGLSLKRRRFYQFAFFFSLLRVFISLFRGAMAGTLLAIILATFFVDSSRRWKWVKSLLIFISATAAIMTILITAVPAARTTFNVAFVRRMELALKSGSGAGSLQFRELEMQKALDDIRLRPIMGYGPGVLITKNFDEEKFARKELYLHSGYIWFWYKMGVMGLGVIVVFFGGIFGTCMKLLKKNLEVSDRGWVVGTLAATISMLPVIHTNNMLIRSQGAYALSLLLFGLCLITYKYNQGTRKEPEPEETGEIR